MIVRGRRPPDRAGALAAAPVSHAGAATALAALARCPRYAPTPLVRLDGAAEAAGVGAVFYKDESGRFGLGSFKALGGAYAVGRLLAAYVEARLGRPVGLDELVAGDHRELTAQITVCCASDGNHGRSVAAGARLFGCACVVFLHEGVSEARADAIRDYGGRVERSAGDYDRSVAAAAETAAGAGWDLVSDTTAPGVGARVIADVMQGYTVMAEEVVQALGVLGEAPPTHVFLQAGVGGMAAAVAAHLLESWPAKAAPTIVIVEPERADCLLQSAIAGSPTPASGDLETVMAGLSCGEVSEVAWPVLDAAATAFMTVPDAVAVELMGALARGGLGARIEAGESATAGLAGLFVGAAAPGNPLGLDGASRVLVFGTEGATDPELYARLIAS